jgi:DNA-binding transcriptional ArsR family regulator
MEKQRLDPASLKALAHPLRNELFRALGEGPATSAQLARRLGQNTGTVSWHLRHLARFGFIEDAPELGDERERWWRRVASGATLDIRDAGIRDDPAALEAARWYVRDSWAHLTRRLDTWFSTADRWPSTWIGASVLSDTVLHLTATELKSLQEELLVVVEKYRRDDGSSGSADADIRQVQVAFQAFPIGDADDGE